MNLNKDEREARCHAKSFNLNKDEREARCHAKSFDLNKDEREARCHAKSFNLNKDEREARCHAKSFNLDRLTRNRLLYGAVLLVVLGLTWMYGGRMLYVSLYAMVMLPVFSCLLTLLMLYGLRVTQACDYETLVKEESGVYRITIQNRTPLMFEDVRCLFADDRTAVEAENTVDALFARPFMRETHEVTFRIKYRGEYRLGLRALQVKDLLGIFTLKRKLKGTVRLTVLPRIMEMPYFPLAMNLHSQAHSRFDIKEEDYSDISDIRPYEPTDSIKRVHWKLTAKRGNWLVKNFQSNALNRISIIMDNARHPADYEEMLALEDRMVETALAVIRYCLRRQMPVEFMVGASVKKTGMLLGDFDAIYTVAAGIIFEEAPEQNRALTLLDRALNESSSYINVVIVTAALDAVLYERIINANHNGHFVALLYFAAAVPEPASEEVFWMLSDGGAACYRLTEDTKLYE